MKFGVHAGLQNTSTGELQQLWRRIEGHGFEWISIWDHFYAADATGGPVCLEAVATHAALALATERVRCGSLVYSVGYRHPAVLANAMATIDHLSGGRVTLGLGAGWHQGEYHAYGMPFPAAGVRLRQLDEAIQCVRGLLTQDVTNFEGEHFRLQEARCEPKPVQARLPIWIGGGGEKVTLRIAARHADGWNVPFISPDDYGRKVRVLDRHCEREGGVGGDRFQAYRAAGGVSGVEVVPDRDPFEAVVFDPSPQLPELVGGRVLQPGVHPELHRSCTAGITSAATRRR